ncbi:MAG: hypothetical protein LKG25_04545 [Prevotella sp.]|jgi:uncharacterized protein (DUF2164 family)|nr:hypothetical protein [Prevotella sp.]
MKGFVVTKRLIAELEAETKRWIKENHLEMDVPGDPILYTQENIDNYKIATEKSVELLQIVMDDKLKALFNSNWENDSYQRNADYYSSDISYKALINICNNYDISPKFFGDACLLILLPYLSGNYRDINRIAKLTKLLGLESYYSDTKSIFMEVADAIVERSNYTKDYIYSLFYTFTQDAKAPSGYFKSENPIEFLSQNLGKYYSRKGKKNVEGKKLLFKEDILSQYSIDTDSPEVLLQRYAKILNKKVNKMIASEVNRGIDMDIRSFKRIFAGYISNVSVALNRKTVRQKRAFLVDVNDKTMNAFALFLGYRSWKDYCKRKKLNKEVPAADVFSSPMSESVANAEIEKIKNQDLLRIDLKPEKETIEGNTLTAIYLRLIDKDRNCYQIVGTDGTIRGLETGDKIILDNLLYGQGLSFSKENAQYYGLPGTLKSIEVVENVKCGQLKDVTDILDFDFFINEVRYQLEKDLKTEKLKAACVMEFLKGKGFNISRLTLSRALGLSQKAAEGHTEDNPKPNMSTLDTLAKYLGYHSYGHFIFQNVDHSVENVYSEPFFFADMQIGEKWTVAYAPNREFSFIKDVDGRCRITHAKASENLKEGDKFAFQVFRVGAPMVMTDYEDNKGKHYKGYSGQPVTNVTKE